MPLIIKITFIDSQFIYVLLSRWERRWWNWGWI